MILIHNVERSKLFTTYFGVESVLKRVGTLYMILGIISFTLKFSGKMLYLVMLIPPALYILEVLGTVFKLSPSIFCGNFHIKESSLIRLEQALFFLVLAFVSFFNWFFSGVFLTLNSS
jgi:hypothetical protein